MNHKRIGLLYVGLSLTAGFLGWLLSHSIRWEMAVPGHGWTEGDHQAYNVSVTLHGLVMVFGFVMPFGMGGAGNVLLPVKLGAPEMSYPRLNNLSW